MIYKSNTNSNKNINKFSGNIEDNIMSSYKRNSLNDFYIMNKNLNNDTNNNSNTTNLIIKKDKILDYNINKIKLINPRETFSDKNNIRLANIKNKRKDVYGVEISKTDKKHKVTFSDNLVKTKVVDSYKEFNNKKIEEFYNTTDFCMEFCNIY